MHISNILQHIYFNWDYYGVGVLSVVRICISVMNASRVFLCIHVYVMYNHKPPCIGKLASVRTIVLIPPHIMGVQVDIRKLAAS